MKIFRYMPAIAAAIFFALCPASLRADEASRKAAAEEMLQAMRSDEMMNKMLERQKEALVKMIPSLMPKDAPAESMQRVQQMMPKVMDATYKQLTWESLKPDFIQIYSEVFTEQELKDIAAFYRTPLGQKLLEKMPEVSTKSMQIVQKRMVTIMPEVQKVIKETIEREKAEKKPPATPSPAAN